MIVVENPHRYISEDVMLCTFKEKQITYVDKVMCGNGFTTAFLNHQPKVGKKKILIAPNKGVVIDKEAGGYSKEKGYSFVYKESTDLIYEAKWIVIVVDTFFFKLDLFLEMAKRGEIESIMVDEFHSAQQQSSFRSRLIMFDRHLKRFTPYCPVVAVTATPTMYQETSVLIKNTHESMREKTLVKLCNDQKLIEDRAHKLIKEGKKVVLATNNASIISRFKNRDGELEARFIVGNSLLRNLTERCAIIENEDSDLVVLSSRGFEGVDIHGDGWNVFFFENRRRESETFFLSNLIQAINRVRDGAESIYYARLNRDSRPDIPDIKEVTDLMEDRSITTEKKQAKKYNSLNKYILFDNDTGSMSLNVWKYQSDVETKEYDRGVEVYADYLNERNIKIMRIEAQNKPLPTSPKRSQEDFLLRNSKLIEKYDLFGDDFRLVPYKYESIKDAKRAIDEFIRRKNYKRDYTPNSRLKKLQVICDNQSAFNELIRQASKKQKAYYYQKKFKNRPDEAEANYKSFSKNVVKNVWYLLFCLANDRISFPKNLVGNRDFNGLVPISESVIKYVSEEIFDLQVHIFDIKNAYPRILYALNGLELKDDFYGKDKRNKVKINIALNALWHGLKGSRPRNARRSLLALNFEPKVVDYYMDHFYGREHKDGVYNTMAYHERIIINKAKEILRENSTYIGYGRRHDSLVYFGFKGDENELLSVRYLDLFGWF